MKTITAATTAATNRVVISEPWSDIEDLRQIAAALARWQGKHRKLNASESRDLSHRFMVFLGLPKRTKRAMWLKLAQNPRAFIRKRYIGRLQDGLTQREANVLWQLHCALNDQGLLETLAMSNVDHSVADNRCGGGIGSRTTTFCTFACHCTNPLRNRSIRA